MIKKIWKILFWLKNNNNRWIWRPRLPTRTHSVCLSMNCYDAERASVLCTTESHDGRDAVEGGQPRLPGAHGCRPPGGATDGRAGRAVHAARRAVRAARRAVRRRLSGAGDDVVDGDVAGTVARATDGLFGRSVPAVARAAQCCHLVADRRVGPAARRGARTHRRVVPVRLFARAQHAAGHCGTTEVTDTIMPQMTGSVRGTLWLDRSDRHNHATVVTTGSVRGTSWLDRSDDTIMPQSWRHNHATVVTTGRVRGTSWLDRSDRHNHATVVTTGSVRGTSWLDRSDDTIMPPSWRLGAFAGHHG